MPALNPTLSTLCYLCGYGSGLLAFFWIAERRKLMTSGVLSVLGIGTVGGLAAANVTQWLVTGQPGKTVLGAILGGYIAVFMYKRHIGLRRPLGDLFAVALMAGEAVGRWGCYWGGCCYGRVSSVPWAVWQHGAERHPTQIYLSLACLLIIGVLVWGERRNWPENTLFCVQGILYCAARFGIEFCRETPTVFGGLSPAQWACLGGLLFFGLKGGLLRRHLQMAVSQFPLALPEGEVRREALPQL